MACPVLVKMFSFGSWAMSELIRWLQCWSLLIEGFGRNFIGSKDIQDFSPWSQSLGSSHEGSPKSALHLFKQCALLPAQFLIVIGPFPQFPGLQGPRGYPGVLPVHPGRGAPKPDRFFCLPIKLTNLLQYKSGFSQIPLRCCCCMSLQRVCHRSLHLGWMGPFFVPRRNNFFADLEESYLAKISLYLSRTNWLKARPPIWTKKHACNCSSFIVWYHKNP